MYTNYDDKDPSNNDDYREPFPNIPKLMKTKLKTNCNRNLILDRLPIVKWLPKYEKSYIAEDIVAGLTVALTVVPQAIAYAAIAGLEPQYGLYSAFMGCFVYFILGTCKDITIGPTAILSLMVQIYSNDNSDYAILVAFLGGIIILLLGLFNLGFLVQFISIPVTAGFTTAAAITIASGQIKTLLGLPGKSNEFIESWENVFFHITEIQLWDSVLGISTILFLLALMKLKDVKGKWRPVAKYISLSRNALAVIFGTIIAYTLYINGRLPFTLTGPIASSFPTFNLPPFTTTIGNHTLEFGEMVSNISTSLFAIPMVAILEIVAISKAFSKGKAVDATQELISLGMCNILGSFFQSMPVTGSFSRTAINNASGVRTTLGGVYTGIIVLLSLAFLTQTFEYIPKTVLAAVIITAVIFMVEFKEMFHIWKTRRIDVLSSLATFIGCLIFGLEIGIVVGIATNVLILLRTTSRPNTYFTPMQKLGDVILLITPDQNIVFSGAEYLKSKILRKILAHETQLSLIILNGEFVQNIDYTVANNMHSLAEDLKLQSIHIYFWNWNRQPISVAYRLNKEFGKLFIKCETIEDIIYQINLLNNDRTAIENI